MSDVQDSAAVGLKMLIWKMTVSLPLSSHTRSLTSQTNSMYKTLVAEVIINHGNFMQWTETAWVEMRIMID